VVIIFLQPPAKKQGFLFSLLTFQVDTVFILFSLKFIQQPRGQYAYNFSSSDWIFTMILAKYSSTNENGGMRHL